MRDSESVILNKRKSNFHSFKWKAFLETEEVLYHFTYLLYCYQKEVIYQKVTKVIYQSDLPKVTKRK